MNKKLNDDIEKYLNEVRNKIQQLYSNDETNSYMDGLRLYIYDYMQATPSCTFDDIKRHISMNDIYSDWLDNTSSEVILKTIDKRSIHKKVTICLLIVSIIIIFLASIDSVIERMIDQASWDNITTVKINN